MIWLLATLAAILIARDIARMNYGLPPRRGYLSLYVTGMALLWALAGVA